MTDNEGKFAFRDLAPGYFTISVKMLGYVPYAKNIDLKDKPVDLRIALAVNSTRLKEVVIGADRNRELFLNAFKEQFLGATINGKSCVLLNPQAVNFTTNKEVLMADADEFLMVENRRLGYKIRYMLKSFWYNASSQMTNYEGDAIFEDMPGTQKQKQQWAKNRAEAYAGSLVHFLRSVYNNSVLQEGFLAYKRYPQPANSVRNDLIYVDPRPVKFDSLVTPVGYIFRDF